MAYTINVTYFKPSGKYYSEGTYTTVHNEMHIVFEEFEKMLQKGVRPGLINGHSDFTSVLDCSEHPNGYPAMFPGMA